MIKLIHGDITQIPVDAIVNSANNALVGGTGVNGIIHKIGGPAIMEGCIRIKERMQGGCPTGEAVITEAGLLPAKYVIHTVGPIWNGGSFNEPQLLANAYLNSLKLAIRHNVKTISFPNISTGVYRYPKHAAAEIAITTVTNFLSDNNVFDEVIFVCFDDENIKIYTNLIAQ